MFQNCLALVNIGAGHFKIHFFRKHNQFAIIFKLIASHKNGKFGVKIVKNDVPTHDIRVRVRQPTLE